nr:hypothetical protein [Tanacetum cinerariifolium]
MASFDYHLNPLYPIKECSSCGALYTTDYCCSDGSLRDKTIYDLDTTPDLSQRSPQNCPKCGNPVDDASEPSNDNTNVFNALQEPFVVKQDPDGNSFTYDSKSNLVHDSPNIFDPSLQPPFYSCEFCENDARYGHYCSPQVPFIYPEPCYNQDFNFPQDFHDFQQQYLCCENCGVTHEAYQYQPMNEDYYHEQNSCYDPNSFGFDQFQPPQYTINHPIFNVQNDLFNSQNKLMEQLTSMCDTVGQYIQKKEEEKQIEKEQAAKTRYWKILACYDDDDEDYAIAVTPSLSTEELDNSLSMGDKHFDTVLKTESDEFIKSSVESLVPIPSESEGFPDNMCDVPFHDNSPPLDVLKDQFEDFSDSNDEYTSIDEDSFSIDNIEYVEASPLNSELVSSEVMEIVISEVGGIDDDILLTIKDDILHEKLLNINLLIANIEALNDNPTPSSNFMTNGSTTTHSDSSLYDLFIFDLLINPFPPVDRSDFYEFADKLAHIIYPPENDCFCFKNEPNSGDFTMDVVEDIFPTREPRVHNALPTHPSFQLNLDFILSSESLFAYVVWIFLSFLSYSVAP